MAGKPPDFQFPTSIVDILGDDAEKILGPNYMNILQNLAEWERALEDRVIHPEVPASLAGAITASVSTPWYPKKGVYLTEFHVLLGTAGSTDTVVIINKNGTPVTNAEVTIASGDTVGAVYLRELWANSLDVMTFEITSAGTGAEDLTAIARFV